jgi:chitin synthase
MLNPCTAVLNDTVTCAAGEVKMATFKQLDIKNTTRQVGFDWAQLNSHRLKNYIVIDGNVLNMDPYMAAYPMPIPNDLLDGVIRDLLNSSFSQGGRDGTKMFFRRPELKASVNCLVQKYRAGHIDKTTTGCFVASIILVCSLAVVLAIVLARFFMALIFSWFISRKLSRTPPPTPNISAANVMKNQTVEMASMKGVQRMDSGTTMNSGTRKMYEIGNDLYTVLLITCYSENTEGIRATVESLSATEYPDDRKLLFLIADGIITGHGETISTPDMCLSLITFDDQEMKEPEPMPYIAVAVGAKQYNCAKVYAGHYGK